VPRKKGRYEIAVSGRRPSPIHAAIEAKELDPNLLEHVLVIHDPEDADEDSLVENFHRLNMSAAEDCIAFQAMIQPETRTSADIARRCGLTECYVLGRVRHICASRDRSFGRLRPLTGPCTRYELIRKIDR
jgi:ParB family chromosome partitioning protein